MSLPPDSHVHSEWSWDTTAGSMADSCARAVQLGLPAIAFTEHLDPTVWRIELEGPYALDRLLEVAGPDGLLTPPVFDAAGYLDAVEGCRERFPGLRILSGLEVGEPHRDPHEVMREYLAGVAEMMSVSGMFSVLAHIDYPVRSWPAELVGPFDPTAFEEEFRHALRATARSGRALEINTRLPLHATILTWWHQEGGDAVTFGSDAHIADLVGHGFADAAQMAEAHGFRPGTDPFDLWGRAGRSIC